MNDGRIALLKKYIEEEPENPFNAYALAMEYYDTEPASALRLLQDLLSTHPGYLPSYYKVAHLLWEEEKWDQAEGAFIKGIQLAKEYSDSKALSELESAYQNFQFDKD